MSATDSKLITLSINNILDYKFYIPAYQRGYRWTTIQVDQLLNDIWNFKCNMPKVKEDEEKPFYCLQPIVVKARKINNETHYEVIDGQQRLTTILIILYYYNAKEFKNPKRIFSLKYKTRSDSESYLLKIEDAVLAESNIDYFHIHAAYQTINKWFSEMAKRNEAITGEFYTLLINHVRVIWYEIDKTSESQEDSASIDVFTRLNIGKIPLTNAELVKALFLQKDNFNEASASLKQIQIASEWDTIEKMLHNPDFWYFIYNTSNPIKYENRIEYIFDLMYDKKKDYEYYYTFNKFFEKFSKQNLENGKADIDEIWLSIKKYFLVFEEWFNNRELYHLIGFLIHSGSEIKTLYTHFYQSTKIEFIDYLKKEIQVKVAFQLSDLNYKDKPREIERVLLLFNIQTILSTQKADIRFPFHKYKVEAWDIEHVHSQTEKEISLGNRKEWALDILEFFTGEEGYSDEKAGDSDLSLKETQIQAIESINDQKEKAVAKELIQILDSDKLEEEKFEKIKKDLNEIFREDKISSPDNISNLTLLDSATNRSYKNAMFPIKRKRIIANDRKGIFVPICTKNLFLKYYSKKSGNGMFWNSDDSKCYLNAIKDTLNKYLPLQQN